MGWLDHAMLIDGRETAERPRRALVMPNDLLPLVAKSMLSEAFRVRLEVSNAATEYCHCSTYREQILGGY